MRDIKERFFAQYYTGTGEMVEVHSKSIKGLKKKLYKHPIVAYASLHDSENPQDNLGYYKPRHHTRHTTHEVKEEINGLT